METAVNLWPLIGVAVIIAGFILKQNPVMIVIVAAIVTGLSASMSIETILTSLGTGFIKTRNLPLILLLPLAIIGLLERYGLKEQAQILTRKEQMEEFMFLGLRMNEGVTRAAFEQSFGVPIEAVYLETLRKLKEQGLLQMVAGRIALTDKGMDLANYVMAKFLL